MLITLLCFGGILIAAFIIIVILAICAAKLVDHLCRDDQDVY